jgi:hypothetical protein
MLACSASQRVINPAQRKRELAAIKRAIPKIDSAFAPVVKNLVPSISGRLQEKCDGSIWNWPLDSGDVSDFPTRAP